nr:hypothetical protein [Pandoravirus massiliensis]
MASGFSSGDALVSHGHACRTGTRSDVTVAASCALKCISPGLVKETECARLVDRGRLWHVARDRHCGRVGARVSRQPLRGPLSAKSRNRAKAAPAPTATPHHTRRCCRLCARTIFSLPVCSRTLRSQKKEFKKRSDHHIFVSPSFSYRRATAKAVHMSFFRRPFCPRTLMSCVPVLWAAFLFLQVRRPAQIHCRATCKLLPRKGGDRRRDQT